MKYDEAIDVLETIEELFDGKFTITKRKLAVYVPQLERMEYDAVMDKLFYYASQSPFPPTLADIAVLPPKKNEYLEKMKVWEEEAALVPEETKRLFAQKFAEMVRRKSE
ncbi:hypothetical protein [Halobacillus sp. BBL2006]|uniref:hypothetical protein n=1 Tax=Halobacillus sp. BBL2006 TaxID=1543706 RepID=UPI0005441C6D|nr:hypothetical protein [Halobacillus sp. BBL2006]KHE72641.1 hypothetical protein LD39_03485 [Halobacillus sp. BBL2006]